MTADFHDLSKVRVLREEGVLEKFLGDPEDGVILERITVLDGKIIKHEVFDNDEGGNDATN